LEDFVEVLNPLSGHIRDEWRGDGTSGIQRLVTGNCWKGRLAEVLVRVLGVQNKAAEINGLSGNRAIKQQTSD
jgi:hypothetical protein